MEVHRHTVHTGTRLYSSSLESESVLFCLFLVWENAAPKAMPMPIPIPKLPVAAPIPMPIATPAKNFNSLLISKSTHHPANKKPRLESINLQTCYAPHALSSIITWLEDE